VQIAQAGEKLGIVHLHLLHRADLYSV